MNLADVQETMHDFVIGRVPHHQACRQLGFSADSTEGQRLKIWRRAYAFMFDDNAKTLFPVTRKVFVSVAGEPAWSSLVERLGTESPPDDVCFASAGLVERLADEKLGVPAWVPELADFELAERRVFLAPDVSRPAEFDACAIRIAAPLLLRRYSFDVFAVRNAPDPTQVAPKQAAIAVAIWRHPDGTRRSMCLTATGARVLATLNNGGIEALEALAAANAAMQRRCIEALRKFLSVSLIQGCLPSHGIFAGLAEADDHGTGACDTESSHCTGH